MVDVFSYTGTAWQGRAHKLVYLERVLEERLFYDPGYTAISHRAFADNEVRSRETMTKEWRKVTIGKFQVKMFPDSGIVSRGAINSWRRSLRSLSGLDLHRSREENSSGDAAGSRRCRHEDPTCALRRAHFGNSVQAARRARWIVNPSLQLFHRHSRIRECRSRNFPADSRTHARLIFHSF